jgi:hypothetical protein
MTEATDSPIQSLPDFSLAFILDMSIVDKSPLIRSIGGRETPVRARFLALCGANTPTLPVDRDVEEVDEFGWFTPGSAPDFWAFSRSVRSLSC